MPSCLNADPKKAGKQLPLRHSECYALRLQGSGLQIFLHQYFTAHGGMFQFLLTVLSGFILRHDIFNGYNIAIQLTLQFGQ